MAEEKLSPEVIAIRAKRAAKLTGEQAPKQPAESKEQPAAGGGQKEQAPKTPPKPDYEREEPWQRKN